MVAQVRTKYASSGDVFSVGALRLVTGKYYLPDARNETLRPCRVRRVFVAKLLNHHPLLRADAKRAEDRERDQVRRTCRPIRDDERQADGIQVTVQVVSVIAAAEKVR